MSELAAMCARARLSGQARAARDALSRMAEYHKDMTPLEWHDLLRAMDLLECVAVSLSWSVASELKRRNSPVAPQHPAKRRRRRRERRK